MGLCGTFIDSRWALCEMFFDNHRQYMGLCEMITDSKWELFEKKKKIETRLGLL